MDFILFYFRVCLVILSCIYYFSARSLQWGRLACWGPVWNGVSSGVFFLFGWVF